MSFHIREAIERLPYLEKIDSIILGLRWLALVLVFVLSLFDRSSEGVLVPALYMILAMAGYNLLIFFLRYPFAWPRYLLNVLALDIIVATFAIYFTGGFHSSFFIIYFFAIIGAAFHLSMVPTILIALITGVVYVATCFVNPARVWSPYAAYMLSAKVALLLMVALLCALLLEQLRREHQETEREKALTARLSALNELFQRLSASLDLDRILQTVTDFSRQLLDANITLLFLRGEGEGDLHLAAASGFEGKPPILDLKMDSELNQPLVVDDLFQRSELAHSFFARKGIASFAGVPLAGEAEAIGLLCVGRRRSIAFSEEDMTILSALGRETALAIRNARLYEREKKQVGQLQALDEMRASFVSTVSHELSTPLTCIKTSVELLQEAGAGAMSGTQEELLRTITHHTDRLETLVTELLDITRLETGQLTLSLQPTDLRVIVRRAVEVLSPLFDEKEQTIGLDLPSEISSVAVDRRRIEQVLTNLLSNANKFTPRGGHIEVALAEGDGFLEVAVSDNGPGIPPSERECIFEKFYVGSNAQGRGGVGLGLYIARQLVELHGGHIWVESTLGKGSTFRFTLPQGMLA
ncbi:MAG: ATP-binding protein [Chloroflexota bacterium]|nr:ATP-binding protein [Chloroflexota bacterium]